MTSATVPSQSLNQNKYSHRDFQKWLRWGSFSTALHEHCQWGEHKLHSFPHTPCRVTTGCCKTTQHLPLSLRAHSKNNHTVIHFRPFYWNFCTTELSLHQDEDDSWVESLQQSLQGLCQIALCGCFWHVGLICPVQRCSSLPFPSTSGLLLSIRHEGKCTNLVPHRAQNCGSHAQPPAFFLSPLHKKFECLGDVHNWTRTSLNHTELPALLSPKNLLLGVLLLNQFSQESLERFSVTMLNHFVIWNQKNSFIGCVQCFYCCWKSFDFERHLSETEKLCVFLLNWRQAPLMCS